MLNQKVHTLPMDSSADRDAFGDDDLVREVRAGRTDRFELLMRRYNQRLYRAARAILANDADAEDAVQQAFLNAYRHLDQFEGRARFSTWLTRILVHEALAKKRRVHAGWEGTGEEEHLGGARSTVPDPERQAYATELGALLEAALARLPGGYRAVFILREVDGLSTTETARRLRVTDATVKTRLHRAKVLLQRQLNDVTPGDAFPFAGTRCDAIVAAVMSHAPLNAPRVDRFQPFLPGLR